MPDTSGKNKTNKNHRNKKKNNKRLADLAAYTKSKKINKPKTTKEGGSGTIYDPVKKRLDKMKRANPIGSLVTGIQDTVKVIKKKT
jgi:hypothetical protein